MTRSSKPRRLLWVLLLCLAIAAVLAVPVAIYPREPLLLTRAVKAADTSSWDMRWFKYRWITNDEVLFLREGSVQYPVRNGWIFWSRNIKANKDKHLAGLTKAADNSFGKHSTIRISQDGTRLFWTGDEPRIYSCRLDGSELCELPQGRFSRIAWYKDSMHLVEYAMNQQADHVAYGVIHTLGAKYLSRRLKIGPQFNPGESEVFSVSEAGHVTHMWPGSDGDELVGIDVFDSLVGAETKPERRLHVHLPVRGELWEPIFSPGGDRVAWSILQHPANPSPLVRWLHQHLPRFFPASRYKLSLWVSKIDGSRMNEIGYVPIRQDTDLGGPDLSDIPEAIYWLPDGKGVSFLLGNALYVVPAN